MRGLGRLVGIEVGRLRIVEVEVGRPVGWIGRPGIGGVGRPIGRGLRSLVERVVVAVVGRDLRSLVERFVVVVAAVVVGGAVGQKSTMSDLRKMGLEITTVRLSVFFVL